MSDIATDNDSSQAFSLLKRGWVSAVAFPVLIGIISLIITLTCLIHYPLTLNGRARFTQINQDGNSAIMEIDVPEGNLYDIDEGQLIQFRLSDYPYDKFGKLQGQIQYIYGATINNNLKVQVTFPHGLKTDRQYSIGYRYGLKADALVILKDMRFIQRIFARPARMLTQ